MEVLSVGIWFVPVYPHPSWLKMAGVDKVGLSLPCFLLLLVSLNCLFNPLCFDKIVLLSLALTRLILFVYPSEVRNVYM